MTVETVETVETEVTVEIGETVETRVTEETRVTGDTGQIINFYSKQDCVITMLYDDVMRRKEAPTPSLASHCWRLFNFAHL